MCNSSFARPVYLASGLFWFSKRCVKYLLSDVLHFLVRKFAGRDGSQSQFEIFLAEIFVSIKVLITYEKTQKIESTSDFDPTERMRAVETSGRAVI